LTKPGRWELKAVLGRFGASGTTLENASS